MADETHEKHRPLSTPIRVIGQWLDSDFRRTEEPNPATLPDQINWERTLPFIFLHLGCLAVFFGRVFLDRGRHRNSSLPFANVRYHRILSSLLFTSLFQNVTHSSVLFCTSGKQLHAAWSALVGSHSPSSPQALRRKS